MAANGAGEVGIGRFFAAHPAVREELGRADLAAAEARCPHGVPVRARMSEALARLA